jgi:hypothetical protein
MESRPECLDPNLALLRRTGFGLRFPREVGDLLLLKPVRRATLPDTAGNLANVGLRFPCLTEERHS